MSWILFGKFDIPSGETTSHFNKIMSICNRKRNLFKSTNVKNHRQNLSQQSKNYLPITTIIKKKSPNYRDRGRTKASFLF